MNVKFYYYGTTSSLSHDRTDSIDLDVVREQVDETSLSVRSCARCAVHCLRNLLSLGISVVISVTQQQARGCRIESDVAKNRKWGAVMEFVKK